MKILGKARIAALIVVSSAYCCMAADEIKAKTTAEWTVLVYIQANNNLGPYAEANIADMIQGMYADSSAVNILVQWEKPNATQTLRYKVTKNGLVLLGTLNYGMGEYPAQSLIDCTQWVKNDFAAKHYCFILWNHGNGIEDTRARGILYDDYYGTFLSNSNLTLAITAMVQILGQPIDILGMDACLMNMVEIAYQVRNKALYLVGSEQTEPGDGWAYSGFIYPLTANPTCFDPKKLSQTIVTAIGNYYKGQSDYTASAFNMSYLDQLKTNIELVVTNVNNCKKYNATQIKTAVIAARRNALTFYIADYIDLYTFYQKLSQQMTSLRKKATNAAYAKALDTLLASLNQGMQLITTAIVANVDGTRDASAKGISIYYLDPSQPARYINSSYPLTLFAKTSWLQFIKDNR